MKTIFIVLLLLSAQLAVRAQNIVQAEYFIDTDKGFGSNTVLNVTPAEDGSFPFTVSLSGVAPGSHTLFVRMKDADGIWSLTSRYNLEVVKDETGGEVFLVEYFFNTDPGVGNCASALLAATAADGTFTFIIPKSNIPLGAVTMYLRAKDSANFNWSITVHKPYSALPVTLVSFTAQKQNSMAQLAWQSSDEINLSYFNIQRSEDGVQFTTVGKALAKGGVSRLNNYTYGDDISPLKAGPVYYRLQMVDADGKTSYSRVESITIDKNDSRIVIYPNPARRFFLISGLDAEVTISITIKDLAGKTVINQQATGTATQRIDISSLAKGVYAVVIHTNQKIETRKLIIE